MTQSQTKYGGTSSFAHTTPRKNLPRHFMYGLSSKQRKPFKRPQTRCQSSDPASERQSAPSQPPRLQYSVYRHQALFEPHLTTDTAQQLVPSTKPARRHTPASSTPPSAPFAPSHAAAQAGVEPAVIEARRRTASSTTANDLLFRVPDPHALSRMHSSHGGYGRHTGPSATGLARLLAAGAGPLLDREQERVLVQQVQAANKVMQQRDTAVMGQRDALMGSGYGMGGVVGDGVATLSALAGVGGDVTTANQRRETHENVGDDVCGMSQQQQQQPNTVSSSSSSPAAVPLHDMTTTDNEDVILAMGLQARRVLLLRNVRLVLSVARMYHRRLSGAEGANVTLDDLVAAGIEGLSRGIDRFDLSRGVKISTYCYYHILVSMTDLMCDLGRPYYVPREVIEKLAVLHGLASGFRAQHGRPPTVEEMVGVKPEQYTDKTMQRLLRVQAMTTVSLDAPGSGDGSTLAEHLRDPNSPTSSWSNTAMQEVTHHTVNMLLNQLPHKEARVVRLVYGLENGRPMQYRDVAKVVGVSRARVGQLMKSALQRLRLHSQRVSTLDLTGEWHAIMEASTT